MHQKTEAPRLDVLGKGPFPIQLNPGSGPSRSVADYVPHILPTSVPFNTHHTRVPALPGVMVVVRGAMCSSFISAKRRNYPVSTSFPPPPSLGLWESTNSQQGLTGRETSQLLLK